MIAAATWVTRDGVRALRVTPTQAQRRHPELADTGWTQLVRKVAKADTPGMRDQYLCHAHFAPGKPSFFLEPARPAVGYAETVAAGCNPGVVRDVG